MPCISPIVLKNKRLEEGKFKQKDSFRNPRKFISVPCGKCFGCMRMRVEGWVFRHLMELKNTSSAFFITLTYDTEHLPLTSAGKPCFDKTHLQNFFKRMRKWLSKKFPDVRIKYHLASEYGDTFGRPHYHVLLYGYPPDENSLTKLTELWPFGQIDVGQITEASIRYVVEYITQYYFGQDWEDPKEVPFSLYSKKNVIGDYDQDYKDVADYLKTNLIKVYPIDGKHYRVPASYFKKLVDKGYLSSYSEHLISQHAQEYYDTNEENFKNTQLSRGVSPDIAQAAFIAQRKEWERRKYNLKVASKYL